MTLVEAHILLQARLRGFAEGAVRAIWTSLPAHNQENVDEWLTRVLPIIEGAQRQSVHLTDAYLSRALESPRPIGVNADELVGPYVRNGTPPETVYRRPFIATWAALGKGTLLTEALHVGLARATSSAAMDIQLSMRATLGAFAGADDRVVGYRRVPDAGACALCEALGGSFSRSDDLMPIHNHCGCGAEPVTVTSRQSASEAEPTHDGVTPAIREHGELGPLLVNADDSFISVHDLPPGTELGNGLRVGHGGALTGTAVA